MRIDKLINWVWILFVLTIPSFHYLNVRILVVLLVIVLCTITKEKMVRFLSHSWDILLYFSVLLFGVGYSENKDTAWRVMETNFGLIALPIVYSFLNVDKRAWHSLKLLTIGVLFSSVVSVVVATWKSITTSHYEVFFFYQFGEFVGNQPTYFAYYIILVIVWITFLAYYDNFPFPLWIYFLLTLFLITVLSLTGGRTAFIALLLTFSFFALNYLQGQKGTREQSVLFSIIFLLAFFILGSTVIESYFPNQSDNWDRSLLWKSAIKANPDPLFGVGTGDYNSVLNTYFLKQGLTDFAEGSLNAHNQYIQSFFSHGCLGLVVLILILVRPLYLSFKMQYALGILIFFPFIIYGMTEVFLGRYQGIAFFVFCHQFVVSNYYSSRTKLE